MKSKDRPLITLDGVTVRIRDRMILPQTSWEIRTGQNWAILGPNGAGKSALVRALTGDAPHVRGTVTYHFTGSPRDAIGHVSSELHEHLIAREESRDGARDFSRKTDDRERVRDMVLTGNNGNGDGLARLDRLADLLDIRPLLERGIRNLSAGEMRKALIARALMNAPCLLILDEPFNGIDADSQETIRAALSRLMEDGVALLLVTHRREEILPQISHVVLVKEGRVSHQGKRRDILTEERLGRLFHREKPAAGPPSIGRTAGTAPGLQRQEILVEMKNVTVAYREVRILDRLNWTVRRGEHWAIAGRSGSGKSTLLRLIAGDHPQAYANEIYLFGRRRGSGESVWEIRERIGLISSEFQVHYRREITVRDVVASGLFDSVGLYRRLNEEEQEKVHQWLQFFRISHLVGRVFTRLSSGERRMALLARALVKSPELLILDEPCTGLDRENRRLILDTIEAIGTGTDTNLLYVTHHPGEMPPCIDHILRLEMPGRP